MKRALIIDLDGPASTPWHGRPSEAHALSELLSSNSDGTANFEVSLESASDREFDRAGLGASIFEHLYEAKTLALLYLKSHDPLRSVPLPFDEVLSLVGRSQAADKVLFLDIAGTGNGWSNQALASLAISEGMSVIASGHPGTGTADAARVSAFSVLLVRALQGGGADLRGFVTPKGIFALIDESLGATEYRPRCRTSGPRFVSVRSTAVPSVEKFLARLPQLFPSPQIGLRLDPSYEPTNTRALGEAFREPGADRTHTTVMRELHRLVMLGLVVPIGEDHLALAALNSRSCRLTALGMHYWRLAKKAAESIDGLRPEESA